MKHTKRSDNIACSCESPRYKYTVAARCFTYNQSPFIEYTLNGFASQVIDFPVVYIIVDDASTDGEQGILVQWANSHLSKENNDSIWHDMPYGKLRVSYLQNNTNALFVIVLLNENHYQKGKSIKRFDYISEWYFDAKYHAFCEGDDYWPDRKKLMKQVGFLEQNPDYVLTYSNYYIVDRNNHRKSSLFSTHYEGDILKKLLLKGNFIVAPSVCYRKDADNGWKEFRSRIPIELKMGDKPHWLYLAKIGKIKYQRDVTVAYRELPESASHSNNIEKLIEFSNNGEKITLFFNEIFEVGIPERVIKRKYAMDRLRKYLKCSSNEYRQQVKKTILEFPSVIFSPKIVVLLLLHVLFNIKY